MNKLEFDKLRSVQLEIMDEVHRVCCENNLTYYIIGGTALGAVRHGGYIPWDVDIDIAMPRKDYERLAEISDEVLNKRFKYRNYKNTKKFTHPHALVCVNNTFLSTKSGLINTNEENLGIYLDVFPLDNAPTDKALQQAQVAAIEKNKRTNVLKRAYRYKKNFKNTVIKKVVSKLMFYTTVDKLNAEFDEICRMYENNETGLWCSMSSHYSYAKQCMPNSVYGKPQLVKFEGREYYAPEQLDDYLTRIYGDYMKLPPEEERQANLGFFEKVVFDR